MRGSKAKKIRKAAERLTAKMLARKLIRGMNGGNVNHPNTTRGVYLKMKRTAKKARWKMLAGVDVVAERL